MDKADMIWTAGFMLNRGPIDAAQLITAGPVSCQVTNSEGPIRPVTYDMAAENAIKYVAEVIQEDPADLDLISVDWVIMEFIDASELPPPPPE